MGCEACNAAVCPINQNICTTLDTKTGLYSLTTINDTFTIQNFCAPEGIGGDHSRSTICPQMSTGGEWGNPVGIDVGGCYYQDGNIGCSFTVSAGCCMSQGLGCSIIGEGVQCTRESFTGDPLQCCLNDFGNHFKCNEFGPLNSFNQPILCFSDDAQQNTCSTGITYINNDGVLITPPDYINIASADCQPYVTQYCSGNLPSDSATSLEWINRWTEPNSKCTTYLFRNMYADQFINCNNNSPIIQPDCNLFIPEGVISATGYYNNVALITTVLEKYAQQGFILGTIPGQKGYNIFQDFLYTNVCCAYPGICQEGINKACSSFSASSLSTNPQLTQWCGCHLPASEYEAYSVNYNIPPECSPTCNIYGNIPIVGINLNPILCEQSTCIVDNLKVNLINSQIGGNINFNQICNNCGAADCSCIVSNNTVDVINSTIGGNFVPLSDGCGSYTCNEPNPNSGSLPATVTVPCGSKAYTTFVTEENLNKAQLKAKSGIAIMIIIGIFFILIFGAILILRPNLYQAKPGTLNRPLEVDNKDL